MDNPQQFESHADGGIDLGKLSLKEAIRAIKNLSIGSILAFGGLLFAILGGAFGFGRWTEVHAPHQVHRPPMPNSSLIQSGLTGVSNGLSNEQLRSFLLKGRKLIRVVVPWFIDPLTVRDALDSILRDPNAEVEIFFLDINSPHLVERGRVARPDLESYGPNETRRSIG